jgi:hypothetical protein
MSSKTQSFATHARWLPIYHFLASPITGIYAVYAIVLAIKAPSSAAAWHALWAVGISAAVLSSRIMAITVQNRVIRLEMRLRLKEILSPAEAERARVLSVRQLIALRFASDAELPSLVERTLEGEFEKPRDIKAAIKDWQADWLRA